MTKRDTSYWRECEHGEYLIECGKEHDEMTEDKDRCLRRDGAGRECRMVRESTIHKTDSPNAEIRTAAHPFVTAEAGSGEQG